MLSQLIVAYLFLGGLGGGLLTVLSFIEFTQVPSGRNPATQQRPEALSTAWLLCLAVLVLAVACLLFDVGRIDRVLSLFICPSLTPLTIGSYSLALAIICAAAFVGIRALKHDTLPATLMIVLSVLAGVIGIVTSIYTGFLLQSLVAVAMWDSYLIPVLFLLSSISAGIACWYICCAFSASEDVTCAATGKIIVADMIILLAETATLGLFIALAYLDPKTTTAAEVLISGELSWLFWPVLLGLGLLSPLALELYTKISGNQNLMVWASILVLIGALVLRILIAEVSVYEVAEHPFLNTWDSGFDGR